MKIQLHPNSERALDRAVQQIADAAGDTAKQVLTAQMRLFAVDLAEQTRPVGKKGDAKATGNENVAKRVRSIYLTVAVAVSMLSKKRASYGATFSRMIDERRFQQASELLTKHGGGGVYTVGSFDGGTLHQSQQNAKRPRNKLVVVDYAKVESYIKKVQKLVGFAKGGFATAGRQLGGVRGIPGFATRQSAPGSATVTGDGKGVVVTMTNDVKYLRQALDTRGEAKARGNRVAKIPYEIKRMMARKMSAIQNP